MERPRRRRRDRVHRHLHRPREGRRPPRRQRRARRSSPRRAATPTPPSAWASTTRSTTPRAAHGDLERVVHHQLPRADGQGAQRLLRPRAGPHDDGPRLHQRPVAAGPRQGHAQRQARPAPHAGRQPVDHPEQHRRGEGHRPRAPGARGQAQRHVAARPGADRFDHRPVGDPLAARSPSTRSTPRSTPPATTSRTAACSSTPTSRWCRPTSWATRRRASSRPRTR